VKEAARRKKKTRKLGADPDGLCRIGKTLEGKISVEGVFRPEEGNTDSLHFLTTQTAT